MRSTNEGDKDTRYSLAVMRMQSECDQREINETIAEKNYFRNLSLKHYIRALKNSHKYDLLIFRCVSVKHVL
jgi:hypothetical protein